ncbi:MAG: hypothetical protein IPM54_04745 [Polyangiaceae bacterium]|nr:hypothetical protein [Polyangiaceae bacterium]
MNLFLTHRDVARRLQNAKAAPWVDVVSNPHEIRIYVADDARQGVPTVLSHLLGGAWDPLGSLVKLQSVPGTDRILPVHYASPDEIWPVVTRPLWKGQGIIDLPPFPDDRTIASYHSYKGGVGRTTTLLATLAALLQRRPPSRVLVVDADVEAPGLTWMLRRSEVERPSFLDTLALIHDADDWRVEAIPLVASLVRTWPVTLDLPDVGQREFFFLPAMRNSHDLLEPPVIPEQVVRRHGRAFVVGDALHALAVALDVNVVLVDARAGISEFASPLFLDPRIESFAVTTCDSQSVEGTLVALDAARERGVARTTVVVSMVPPGDAGEHALTHTRTRLLESLVEPMPASAETLSQADANIEVLAADFAQELLGGGAIEDLLGIRIPGTRLGKDVGSALATRLVHQIVAPVVPTMPFSIDEFIRLTERMEYAELNAEPGLLSIPALRALVTMAPNQLPNRVVLGAKGAGKTFAWGQMVLAGDWSTFAQRVRDGSPLPPVPILPLLQSEDLGDAWTEKIRRKERELGIEGISPIDALSHLEKADESIDPVAVWVNVIRARLALPQEPPSDVLTLVNQIRERFERVILVTDGLERFFQIDPDSPMPESKRRLLRALLQDIPNRLREQPECPLGLVTFLRRDLAAAVITQNFGQFEARNADTSLRWSPTEAIRLVGWLLQSAHWPPIQNIAINEARMEDLVSVLYGFWNEKMGGDKDAKTWKWVLAALSDFNAVVQARDLVRFLRAAAQQHAKPDLPLAPAAMRKAIPEVSAKKVDELESEIPGLRPVFDKLRRVSPELRVVPFIPADLSLTSAEVAFLETLGLLIRPDRPEDDAYLQEVVRHGLGYGLGRRGRARIVSLYTQALRRTG